MKSTNWNRVHLPLILTLSLLLAAVKLLIIKCCQTAFNKQRTKQSPKPKSPLFLYLAGHLSDFNLFVPNHTTGVSNLLSGIL